MKRKRCIVNGDREPDVLMWGDSNAAHYVGALSEIAREVGFSFRNITHSWCAPFLDRPERFETPKVVRICADFMDTVPTFCQSTVQSSYLVRGTTITRTRKSSLLHSVIP